MPDPSEGISDERVEQHVLLDDGWPHCSCGESFRGIHYQAYEAHAFDHLREDLVAAEATIAELTSERDRTVYALEDIIDAANQRIAELEREVAHVSSGVNDQWHKTQRAEQRIANLEGIVQAAKLVVLQCGHSPGRPSTVDDLCIALAALSTEEKT